MQKLHLAWKIVKNHIEQAQQQMKTQHDKHSFEPPIKVGDKMFIRQTTVPKGTSAKLAPKLKGPFLSD